MLNYKFGFYALLLESSAWSGASLLAAQAHGALAWYLLSHAGASLLLAIAANLVLSTGKSWRERAGLIGLMTVISYAIPILGFIATVLGTALLRVYQTPAGRDDFHSMQLPSFDPHQRQASGFRQAGLGSFLNNPRIALPQRLGAMVSLQYVPGRVATPMLRQVLGDSNEDLRLLAYGMLDNKEKQINRAIDSALREFRDAEEKAILPLRLRAAQRLSDLYWELIYQELAQGDLRDYALQESLKYCDMVLASSPDNAPLLLRRGRLLHALKQTDAALHAYQQAHERGMPATRILPYLAELAFERHDIAETRRLMHELNHWTGLPKLRPVVDYWTKS